MSTNGTDANGERDQPAAAQPFGSLQEAAAIQANERTLVAWIRTGLMGAALDAMGITRYVRFHRAFVRRQPVPINVTAVLAISGAIAMLGALLGAFVILSLRSR